MKKLINPLLLVIVCIITAQAQPKQLPKFQPTVLLELFSSEGCSSCPLADAFMQEVLTLADSTGSPVYVLDYHVDIWNRSGWVDPFSDTLYSRRQLIYMDKVRQQALFTPMLFVNGKHGFPAGNKSEVGAAIFGALSNYGVGQLTINAAMLRDGKGVNVSYNINTDEDSLMLVLALAQRVIYSKVTSGENAGKTLTHHNTVRALKTIEITEPTGYTSINMPDENAELDNYILIGFIQNKNTWEVYATDELRFRKN